MSRRIYLSGAIDGLTFSEATIWRDLVGGSLHRAGLIVHDPMRHRSYKDETARIGDSSLRDLVLTVHDTMNTDRGITTRDHFDTIHSDLLFVNLLGATKISLGTVAEVSWAWDRRIPVLAVLELSGNPHEHPMFREMVSYRVESLDSGIQVALSVLNVGDPVIEPSIEPSIEPL